MTEKKDLNYPVSDKSKETPKPPPKPASPTPKKKLPSQLKNQRLNLKSNYSLPSFGSNCMPLSPG